MSDKADASEIERAIKDALDFADNGLRADETFGFNVSGPLIEVIQYDESGDLVAVFEVSLNIKESN